MNNIIADKEKEIQKFWQDNKIFEKSLEQTSSGKRYSFYDGPPFATGTPHYGHLVASLMKDVVPRFWTMLGYYVERRWGWDCHGLPIENIVEKELGFKSKKDIEDYGVEKFNAYCRSKVLTYAEEWKKTIARFGRWVDMENAYKTMDLSYMESIWWVFKQLWDKGLVYEGYRSMHICPRCETTLSQSEVTEGYRDIKDISVTVKFELVDEPGTFVLAWTTTPWTLPGNVALAVGEEVDYLKLRIKNEELRIDEFFILAKATLEKVMVDKRYEVVEEFKGRELIGRKYQPLFPYYKDKEVPNRENLYTIVSASFVTTEDGTGVVHIAPAYGEEDLQLGKEKNLSFIQNVTLSGNFKDEVTDLAGLNVKPAEDTKATDRKVIEYLKNNDLLFAEYEYEHSYPHCWRCDTPLLNYSTSSWFVKVTALKERAIELAKNISWSPEHIKEGRFGQWLEGARDWSISRQRFWASCIPIWRCDCGEIKVFGSIEELEEASGVKIDDLHKDRIDKIEVTCAKCGKKVKRIPDVIDCWFESGSMPFAQQHYPFENKEKFEAGFPAQFIAEGVDQTRCWFYYLHVIATAVKDSETFKNVIANGIVLAEDGKKMSKKLQNYPEPEVVMEQYGADALRYYLLTSPVMAAENLNFSEGGVKEAMQKVVMLLNNILSFYKLYTDVIPRSPAPPCGAGRRGDPIEKKDSHSIDHRIATVAALPRNDNILDQWLVAKLNLLIKEMTTGMEAYDLPRAVRPIASFIDEFSTWWLRRSRDRFKGEDENDKQQALNTCRHALLELSKLMAPFTPFIAEQVYREVNGGLESVHLEKWPVVAEVDEKILSEMEQVRKIVELGLAKRAEAGIKIRQPLGQLKVQNSKFKVANELLSLIAEELNVKEVVFSSEVEEVALDTEITEELKLEGMVRELIRTINNLRKDAGLTVGDNISVAWQSHSQIVQKVLTGGYVGEIKKATISQDFVQQENGGKEIVVNGEKIQLEIKKI